MRDVILSGVSDCAEATASTRHLSALTRWTRRQSGSSPLSPEAAPVETGPLRPGWVAVSGALREQHSGDVV